MASPFSFSDAREDCWTFLLDCAIALSRLKYQYPTERSRVAYVVLRLQGQALLWAAAVWEGPETEALDTFSPHLMAKFGRPARDPAIQAKRLGLHQQVMEELHRRRAVVAWHALP